MSEHHRWYVTGRTVRLAVAVWLFVSLIVLNPAFAVEVTDLTAQPMAISDSPVTAPESAVAERLIVALNAADSSVAERKFYPNAADSSVVERNFDPNAADSSVVERNFDPNVTDRSVTQDVFTPATKTWVGGGFLLAEANQTYQELLERARSIARKLGPPPIPLGDPKPPDTSTNVNIINGEAALPKTGKAYKAVLDLTRDGDPIASNIIVWQRDFDYYIPVASLAHILKFPSTYDPKNQSIQGQFFSPDNTYGINSGAGTYTVRGETAPLPKDALLNTESLGDTGDVYVSVDLLNKIWPLELSLDVRNQSLAINAPKKLPFELEEERKKHQEKLEREKAAREHEEQLSKNYIYTPNGYKLLGPQTFFLSQNLRAGGNNDGVSADVFASGTGDLLGTSANYSVSLSNNNSILKPEDFTISLKREDFKSGKLLPFGLDLVNLGDISVRAPSLVAGSFQGKGILLSTDRNRKDIDFDEVTVEGNAQPGWDVEVYSHGLLIDYGVVDKLGRYHFENVPLTFGNNAIRLVFYGPNGEVEEKIENYSISRSLLKPGDTTYQAGIVKSEERVFDLRDKDAAPNDPGVASTIRINRGISQYMSGFATFSNLDFLGQTEKYISLGTNFNVFEGYGQVEAYKQLNRGSALDLRFARAFMGFDTGFRTTLFNEFESNRTGIGDNRKLTETSVDILKSVESVKQFLPGFTALNLGASLSRTTYADALTDTRFSTSQALGSDVIGNFSNTTNTNLIGGEFTKSGGTLAYSRRLTDSIGFNSRLGYNTYPQKDLSAYNLDFSYTNHDRLTASLGYGQSLGDEKTSTLDLGAAYEFDALKANLNLGWATEDGLSFLLGTSTTLGPEGKDAIYNFRRETEGQPTRLFVHLFEDTNGNAVSDPDDRPVVGARVLLNGGRKSAPSDAEGKIEVAPAGPEGITTITLDRPSMTDNPFLIPGSKDGFVTILRAGTEPRVEFPLVMSGTIDGTVRDQDGRGMPGITVQLINEQGKLAGETATLANGFFVFELVRTGRYVVQVHPSHRVFVPPKTVRVASDSLFIYGTELQVLRNQDLGQASGATVANDVEESGRVAHTYHPRAIVGTEEPVTTTPSGGGVQPAVSEELDDGVQPVIGKTSDGRVQPAIRAVRIGEYSDKARLVLDLSGPAVYRITKESNGTVVTIDLPDTKWEADFNFQPDQHKLFKTFEVFELPGGGIRIRLTGKTRIDPSHDLFLPAEAGKDDRIYIDFIGAHY